MRRHLDPDGLPAAFGSYSHAVLVEQPTRWLVLSGQLGIDRAGSIPDGVAAQAALIFAHLDACLAAAGMTRAHVLRLTTFLVELADRPAFMAVRDRWVADPPPASTLLVVRALARPELLVEVEAIAAA